MQKDMILGHPLGYLEAIVDFALDRDDLREDFLKILKSRV